MNNLTTATTPLSAEESAYIAWTKSMIKTYLYYASLIVTPIGLSLNVLLILVFARKRFARETMGFYYIILGLFDNCIIVIHFLEYYSLAVNRDFTLTNDLACKLIPFLIRLFGEQSSWLQCVITYDRLICVRFSNRVKFLKNKRVLALIIFGLFLAIGLLNFEGFYFSLVKTVTVANVTTPSLSANQTSTVVTVSTVTYTCVAEKSIQFLRDMISAAFRVLVPFLLMVIGNLALIRLLVNSKNKSLMARRKTKSSIKKSDSSVSSVSKEQNFAISVLAINGSFLLVLLPLATTLLISDFYLYVPSLSSPTRSASNTLAYYISIYISVLNNSIPFLINLKFNKHFRAELKSMLDETGLTSFSQESRKLVSFAPDKSVSSSTTTRPRKQQ